MIRPLLFIVALEIEFPVIFTVSRCEVQRFDEKRVTANTAAPRLIGTRN